MGCVGTRSSSSILRGIGGRGEIWWEVGIVEPAGQGTGVDGDETEKLARRSMPGGKGEGNARGRIEWVWGSWKQEGDIRRYCSHPGWKVVGWGRNLKFDVQTESGANFEFKLFGMTSGACDAAMLIPST